MEGEGPDDGVGGWGGTEELSQNHLSRDYRSQEQMVDAYSRKNSRQRLKMKMHSMHLRKGWHCGQNKESKKG